MPSPMNFAVIGCGALAMGQHIPNITRSPNTNLHTCCDLSADRLAECREKHGAAHTTTNYLEVISDPQVEAIVLATTEKLRLPVIAACAEQGKPIYVEKPLANSLEDAYQIQRLVNESGIPFCVGHNRRAAPAMMDAHSMFRSHMQSPQAAPWRYDREGPDVRPQLPDDGVASMSVRINDDWLSWKGWVFDKQQASFGPMLFEMTHFTDICNWFLAAQPVEVVALEGGVLNHGVVIRYEHGEIASILMGSNGTFAYPKELYEVMGQGAIVVVDHMLEVRTAGIADADSQTCYPMLNDRHLEIGVEGGLTGWLAKKQQACEEAAAAGDPTRSFAAEPDKGHARAIDLFVDEIRGLGPVVCDVDSGVLATRVAFAAIKSAQEGRAVKMDEI